VPRRHQTAAKHHQQFAHAKPQPQQQIQASTPADMQANDTRFVLCHSALKVEANARA